MSKSYRIRTQPGVDKSVKVLIDQEFDYLEILSLKILQSDIYTRQCADYGVIVGRVSVNNGFGLPNVKVSVFIPIDSQDQSDPIISELYPYKSLSDVNDDGYRYNLLPYVKSYSAHVPTGTFFTRTDVLTNPTLIQVYDKYYKYNAITNDSGDYMIFGVPVGAQTVVIDVDLSDIGEFSLSPQDLIRMGIATESQVSGPNFRASNNLRELPQIITVNRTIEVEPLWGQPEICNLGITRTDFDLSAEANVEIRPTSIFMGSIISGPNSAAVSTGCRPTNKSGHLCDLTTGPGDILAIRQTIFQDSDGRPILENFSLENGGKVIDENGTWLIDVPMNLDYYVTNEFGEQVLSNDPEKGIPTKGKYRFKVKWSQSPSLSETTRRAYFLIPNIKENRIPNHTEESYAFSVDWYDYAYSGDSSFNQIIQEAIDCEDRFYMMQYNKVYTVSQFINGIRKGRGFERYIGIKNILDETCVGLNNRFPTNDGNFRFDIIYIIFMFFSIILTPVFFVLILVMHILYFLIYLIREYLIWIFIGWAAYQAINAGIQAVACYPALGLIVGFLLLAAFYVGLGIFFEWLRKELNKMDLSGVKVPILTYPECDLCRCSPESSTDSNGTDEDGSGADALQNASNKVNPCETIVSDDRVTSVNLSPSIVPLFNNGTFRIPTRNPDNPTGYIAEWAQIYSQELSGLIYDYQYASVNIGAPYLTISQTQNYEREIYTTNIPMADRINLFNVKAKYFNGTATPFPDTNNANPGGGVNIIKVSFEPTSSKFHFDNTTVLICDKSTVKKLKPGQLISFQNPAISKDINMTKGVLNVYGNNAITGFTKTGDANIIINYANPDGTGNVSTPVVYSVNITGTSNNFHKFPTDVEYFQVITAMTYNQFSGQCSNQLGSDSLNNRYIANTTIISQNYSESNFSVNIRDNQTLTPLTFIQDYGNICVLILNRGVDPYTPKVPISYELGRLFGYNNYNSVSISGLYHMNIPIQGSFKNISHLSGDYPQTTVSGVTAGSNIGVNSYSNNTPVTNQKLYFESFSYYPEVDTILGELTGYTGGQPFVYTGAVNSGYSSFTSNLISYYSSMDNGSFNTYAPSCGGVIDNVVGRINPNVAFQTPQGLRVSSSNRFSWRIYNDTAFVFVGSLIFGPYDVNNLSAGINYLPNTGLNQGYFRQEIIEGGPIMYTNLDLFERGDQRTRFDVSNPNGNFAVTSNYYTPIYNTTGNTLNFSLGLNDNEIVMRGDRLPTSTTVEEYCCNGMVLQKNNNLQMFLIPEEGVLNISSSLGGSSSAGSGDLEYVYEDLAGSTGITRVFDSFTCDGSVNLECYGCKRNGPNGTIEIKPISCQQFKGKMIFEYGCYKFVTTIFISLFNDWKLMFEWIARNMVMLGACRNVFSHRFINNWVNGTLYAFPIRINVKGYFPPTSSTPNQPIVDYCRNTVKYYSKTKNYYYRATDYDVNSGEFKLDNGVMGYPTTIMDLGPRADYLQELVMSDEYDGYVVNRLDSSSYGTVDDILNLFIVSRFVDNSFFEKLLGGLNILAYFSNGRSGTNYQIDADYAQLISINSELGVAPFLSGNYPDSISVISAGSFIVGSQYQIQSLGSPVQTDFTLAGSPNNNIGTTFIATNAGLGNGTALVTPAKQNPIFFDCDNVLGIFFSSDTQIRDYITPKRTIVDGSVPVTSNCSFNNFSVYSQRVPLSQWKINASQSINDSIFGRQFNNWDLTFDGDVVFSHRYQSLDRLDQGSRYFRNNSNAQTQYQKGYIYAVDNQGEISANPSYWDNNPSDEQLVTVGAPFHFYFGLRRGASAFDRFRTKWINTINVVN
jgi:hypothetical protein